MLNRRFKKVFIFLFLVLVFTNKVWALERKSLYEEISSKGILDSIKSEFVESEDGIDFSKISSDTNGKGIYIISSTRDQKYPIYYYRGDVNNNVLFANFCWEIVRTTDTGGIKLIYNGKPNENNVCDNVADQTLIEPALFNEKYDDNTYIGYMYGKNGGTTYEDTHDNINSSNVKNIIDEWYKANLINYTDFLEDTIWCNDRSIASDSVGNGISNEVTFYKGRERLYSTKAPSLTCLNKNDRFTVANPLGNKKLIYPVALLTADEIALAGGVNRAKNTSFYLFSNYGTWTMTPYYFDNSYAGMWSLLYNGNLFNSHLDNTRGIRPMISLSNDAEIIDGNGNVDDPYKVIVKRKLIYSKNDLDLKNTEYLEGEKVSLLKTGTIINGYKIVGWKSNDIEISEDEFIMPNHDVTVTPVIEIVGVSNPNTIDNIVIYQTILIVGIIVMLFLYYRRRI